MQEPSENHADFVDTHFNLDKIKEVIKEFRDEYDLENSLVFLPDKIIWEKLKKILHPNRKVEAVWPEPATPLELPEHVYWLPDRTQKNIRRFIELLEGYHDQPIILDNHETDGEREKSKQAMEVFLGGVFREFVDQSKIRNANIFGLRTNFVGLEYALKHLQAPNEKSETLLALLIQLHADFSSGEKSMDSYLNWTFEEKLKLCETINPIIETFLYHVQELYRE